MKRHALTNDEWDDVKDIAQYKPPRGPEPENVRPMLDGICWILATGAPWRDLPEHYGKWEAVYSRFRAYIKHGVWSKIVEKLQRDVKQSGDLKLRLVCFDGTYIRAHRHAAGARRKKRVTSAPMLKIAKRNKHSGAREEDSRPRST